MAPPTTPVAQALGDRAVELLSRASGLLAESWVARDPGDRFVAAHLAALRAAAAVLASAPSTLAGGRSPNPPPRSCSGARPRGCSGSDPRTSHRR